MAGVERSKGKERGSRSGGIEAIYGYVGVLLDNKRRLPAEMKRKSKEKEGLYCVSYG